MKLTSKSGNVHEALKVLAAQLIMSKIPLDTLKKKYSASLVYEVS
jgi:hypothetical protein